MGSLQSDQKVHGIVLHLTVYVWLECAFVRAVANSWGLFDAWLLARVSICCPLAIVMASLKVQLPGLGFVGGAARLKAVALFLVRHELEFVHDLDCCDDIGSLDGAHELLPSELEFLRKLIADVTEHGKRCRTAGIQCSVIHCAFCAPLCRAGAAHVRVDT